MYKIVFGLLILQSVSGYSYTRTEGLCIESNQSNAFIKIELYEASTPAEETYAVRHEYKYDGTHASEEKMTGKEPDFGIIKAATDKGEKLFIVTTISDKKISQYVCQ